METTPEKSLGETLKTLRESQRFTLRDIEDLTGISNAYLSQLENDKAKNPSANFLHKLAELYKIDLSYLLSLAGIVESQAALKPFSEYVFSKENLSTGELDELMQYLKFMRLRDNKKL